MATSDALVVVEDWISEHFFTSDSTKESFHKEVVDRHKQWKAEESATPLSRFTSTRSALLTAVSALYDDAHRPDVQQIRDTYQRITEVLGYRTGQYRLRADGPVRWVSALGAGDDESLVIVEALPMAAHEDLLDKHAETLLEPWRPT